MGGPATLTIPGIMIGFYDGDLLAGTAGRHRHRGRRASRSPRRTGSPASPRGAQRRRPGHHQARRGGPGREHPGRPDPDAERRPDPGPALPDHQRHVDGQPSRGRRRRADQAGAPRLDAGDDPLGADDHRPPGHHEDLRRRRRPIAFDIGAGQIVPEKALEPGLVYDAGLFDYVRLHLWRRRAAADLHPGNLRLLESLGYSLDSSDLNLPSIAVAALAGEQTVTRTVTSVAKGQARRGASRSTRHRGSTCPSNPRS